MHYPLRDGEITLSIADGHLAILAISQDIIEASPDHSLIPSLVAGILLAYAQELRRPTGERINLDTDTLAQGVLCEATNGDGQAYMRATISDLKKKYGVAHARLAIEHMLEAIEGAPIPAAILAAFADDDETAQ